MVNKYLLYFEVEINFFKHKGPTDYCWTFFIIKFFFSEKGLSSDFNVTLSGVKALYTPFDSAQGD